MREFYLINENNIRYDLQDIGVHAFLTQPSGLGYGRDLRYVKVGHSFRKKTDEPEQDIINAIVNLDGYEKYQEFVNYIENSTDLRLIYKPIDTEYFRNVDFNSITKTELRGRWLQCGIRLNCTGLYYTEDNRRFTLETIVNEARWPLPFPFIFNDYSNVEFNFNNVGHADAEFLAEIFGYLENPVIELYVGEKLKYKVVFDIIIQENEKLLYSAKDGDNFVSIEHADGTQELVADCLRLENNNFFKLPKGLSTLRVESDTGALNKVVFRILTAYKRV